MILRRLSKHVKDQNWFAVALDFLIVVVGILIAFQITEWNEARRDRREEQRYLAELVINLESDIAQAREGQTFSLGRLGVAEAILAEVAPDPRRLAFFGAVDGALPLGVPGLEAYPYASLTSSFFLVSADDTYQELVETGNIGVLTNRALVKDLTAYYDRIDRQREEDGLLLTQAEAMLGWMRESGLGMTDSVSLEDVTARARSDEAFLGFVKMAGFLGHWQYNRLIQIESQAEALLEAVRAEQENDE